MIVLNTATRSLELRLAGPVATNQLPFVVQYLNTTREGRNHRNSGNGQTNGATAVTVLGAPSAGEKRSVETFSLFNADTANVTATVRLNDNATLRNIVVVTLAAGDHLIYTSASGWFVLTASGFIKSTSTAVNLDDLGDVLISNPATGAALIYNGTNWVDGQLDLADADAITGILPSANMTAASDIVAGRIEIAIQSEMESGSSLTLAVTPGRQHFHPSAVKAWVNFDTAGGIAASYGVSSITDNGTGDWTVNFSNAFSTANYGMATTLTDGGNVHALMPVTPVAASCQVRCRNTSGTLTDLSPLFAVFCGDL